VDDLDLCSAATALKRDGRVLFVSSAGCHGDGLGAQQAKDAGQGVVAPVLAFGGLAIRASSGLLNKTEMAGSFSGIAY
jgi:hypothetical protein